MRQASFKKLMALDPQRAGLVREMERYLNVLDGLLERDKFAKWPNVYKGAEQSIARRIDWLK